jgi:hypothetical protein
LEAMLISNTAAFTDPILRQSAEQSLQRCLSQLQSSSPHCECPTFSAPPNLPQRSTVGRHAPFEDLTPKMKPQVCSFSIFQAMKELRETTNTSRRLTLQASIEKILMESSEDLTVPKGVCRDDQDRQSVEAIFFDIRRNPGNAFVQFESRQLLYSILSPGVFPLNRDSARKTFSMLPPLAQALRMLQKATNDCERDKAQTIMEAILTTIDEKILLPADLHDDIMQVLSIEHLLYCLKNAKTKNEKKLYRRKIYDIFFPSKTKAEINASPLILPKRKKKKKTKGQATQ